MKKSNLILSLILVMIISSSQSAYAKWTDGKYIDSYEDNNTFSSAAYIGGWKYNYMDTTTIDSSHDLDYYKFYANKGDKIAIVLQGISSGCNFDLWLYDRNGRIQKSERFSNSNEIVRLSVKESGSYVFAVIPKQFNGSNFCTYNIKFIDRIKKGTYTARLYPSSISSPGKGRDSSIAYTDLSNNKNIPEGAIVTNVEALGRVYPKLGHTYKFIRNTDDGTWYKSVSGSGLFRYLDKQDNLKVKNRWEVKYNSLSWSRSTWSNIKIKFEYEYDQTLSW